MNRGWKEPIVMVLTALVVCANLTAQTQSKASADPAKTYERFSGLDKRILDTTADPCEDFFQYACGNFAKLYPIPNDRSSYAAYIMVDEYIENVLRTILEKAAEGGSQRTPNEQRIGDFFASCTAADAIEANGLKPLQAELVRIAALRSKDELPELLAHYQLINVSAFFVFSEQKDFTDARKQIAVADQGGLGLPDRDFYFRAGDADEKLRVQYVRHIASTFKLMGVPEIDAAADAQKVMQLETALAKVSLDRTSRRNPNNIYHLMPAARLVTLTPAIAWDRFLKATGAPPVLELNIATPDFFKGLNALLASTDLDTIKTYLRWQLIRSIDGLVLPQAFDEEAFDFYGRKVGGQPELRSRWARCVRATDQALGEALGQVYVAQEFPPSSKQATVQMVHDLEAAMEQNLDTLEWMSATTKVRAKEKLHAIVDKIGYPNHWRDYTKLSVIRGDAPGNFLRAVEFENRRELAEIGQPVDRDEWNMTPATNDAYYSQTMNDINFPAGLLQPPMYDPQATDAENYGHLGGFVGHELTHAFDDKGRQFDAVGNLADWWTAEDARKFVEKADCQVKEYGSFVVVDDVKVNGKLTLGENIADNGGLRIAYIAFLADAKRKGIDLTQKQDGYAPLQQFFLGHGQNWCGGMRPEELRLRARTDPHSPWRYRVNGVVQNMPEFGQAFSCKTGQPMMPANYCRVW